MAKRTSNFRYKPVGWRNESYRHYLAAKGIKTKKYFVRNFLKGNRESGAIKSLYAQGYSKEEAYRIFGLPFPEKRRKEPLIDVPDRDELGIPEEQEQTSQFVGPVVPVVSESVPSLPVPEERGGVPEHLQPELPVRRIHATKKIRDLEEPVATTEVPGNVKMTPGVPPTPSIGFNI